MGRNGLLPCHDAVNGDGNSGTSRGLRQASGTQLQTTQDMENDLYYTTEPKMVLLRVHVRRSDQDYTGSTLTHSGLCTCLDATLEPTLGHGGCTDTCGPGAWSSMRGLSRMPFGRPRQRASAMHVAPWALQQSRMHPWVCTCRMANKHLVQGRGLLDQATVGWSVGGITLPRFSAAVVPHPNSAPSCDETPTLLFPRAPASANTRTTLPLDP
jgi:hypothetical protein